MRRMFEVVLHQAILIPVRALAGIIAFLCVACGVLSKIGDHLAGERPRHRARCDELQAA